MADSQPASGAGVTENKQESKDKPKETPKPTNKLFPPFEPYEEGYLKVSEKPLHELFYEQSGNPKGNPVVVLHGGPGGGCAPFYRQFFDPKVYRIIMFDQRGAGKSRPFASLEDNTTWHLVEDIEKLRRHLNIEKWVVFGGSWGACLALAYSETHPDRVKALILRGIFTLRREELVFFYQSGAHFLFPDAFDAYMEPIPPVERHDLMSAYHRRLTGTDEKEMKKCAAAWSVWEMTTSRLHIDHEAVHKAETDEWAVAFARIECHYFVNGGFFKEDGQLIKDAHKIRHIPGTIVQGRYDIVCPMKTAWDLHKAWPEAELKITFSGHSAKEDAIIDELVLAAEKYKNL